MVVNQRAYKNGVRLLTQPFPKCIVGAPPPQADAFDDPSSESDTESEYAEDETYQDDSGIEG